MNRRVTAADVARAQANHIPPSPTATASKYLRHIETLAPGKQQAVSLFCRESSRSQKKHLPTQLDECRKKLESLGFVVRRESRVVGQANSAKARRMLARTVRRSRMMGITTVVAECTSRFVRSAEHHPYRNRDATATVAEFDELMKVADGTTLATIHHPDIPPAEERRRQTKRGMAPEDKRGGRPRKGTPSKKNIGHKAQQRRADLPRALEMFAEGKSLGQVAKALNRSKSTVQGWRNADRTVFAGAGRE